jgi:3-deoxy-7-phosphoheptulonate synthase
MNSSVSALPLSTLDSANEALTLRLPSSLQLKQQLPLSHSLHQQVTAHRQAVRAILDGEDPRLLVIVGPCSIHDPQSAIEYASKLARLAEDVSGEMLLVMRAYVERFGLRSASGRH